MDQKRAFVFVLVSTVIFVGTGFLWIVPALMSVMMFDAPGSEESTITWMCVLTNMAYPPVCFISAIGAWVMYKLSYYRSACAVSLAPLLNVALFVLAIVLLITLQDGKFAPP